MLQLFRTNQVYQIALLLGYALLLRADLLIVARPMEMPGGGLFSEALFEWFGDRWPLRNAFALLLLVGQAILLNETINRHRMVRDQTYVPAVCYVLLASGSPELSQLSAPLLANTFLLLAISALFNGHRRKEAMEPLFNAGFWVAVASLFYLSAWIFLVFALLALALLRKPDLRENLVLVSGFVTVYLLLGVTFFCLDGLPYFGQRHFAAHFSFPHWTGRADWSLYLQFGTAGLLLLWALGNLPTILFKTSIQVQVFLQVLYWAMLFSGLCLFVQRDVAWSHALMLCLPLSIFFAFNLMSLRSRFLAEALHLVVFMAAVAVQYQTYFFLL
jgi:hypothetical protein